MTYATYVYNQLENRTYCELQTGALVACNSDFCRQVTYLGQPVSLEAFFAKDNKYKNHIHKKTK